MYNEGNCRFLKKLKSYHITLFFSNFPAQTYVIFVTFLIYRCPLKIKGDSMLGRIFSKSFWIKVLLYLATVGMVVSCVAFYKGLEGYKSVCPQENYVDKGVHEFRPLRVVRTSNSDGTYNSNRKARMREENSAKWLVIYRAVDKSGYGFKRSFGLSKLKAQEAKKEGNVKRRVLEAYDSQNKKHIYVVKEHENISTHFDSQVAYYSRLLTLPLLYLPLYLVLLFWYFKVYKRKLKESQNLS